ncbi:MAG: hypothetical protein Q7J73_09245, partial [Dehalococcoidales bacterium]|nr:hypothetical protein [Dehalococcoidales bacterium]
LSDDDIPDTITLTRYLDSDIPIVTFGNTASSAFERSLAVKSPLTLTDGGANSTITFGLSSDSLDFDEFVDSMTLDANLIVSSGSGPFSTTWHGDFFLQDNASVSGNFEVSGNASASQTYGSGLTTCTASNNKLTWNSATGKFICATESEGIAGTIQVRETGGTLQNTATLSFAASHFDVAFSSPESTIRLDWGLGGPASLSENEIVTGLWNFNAASTQFDFIELTGTASITVANTAFNINLGGSGDFNILDAGTAVFTVNETNLITLNNEITDHTIINGLASVTSDFEVSGAASVSALTIGGQYAYRVGGTNVSLADGGTGADLADPNADRFFMWDDSAGATVLAGLGGFLTFTNTPTLTVASNSLGFGQLQDTLTLDTNLTVSSGSGPFSTTWHGDFFLKDNASVSGNFEVSGNASASQTYGSGLTTCTASNNKLTWNSSTGKFICATESEGLAGSIG